MTLKHITLTWVLLFICLHFKGTAQSHQRCNTDHYMASLLEEDSFKKWYASYTESRASMTKEERSIACSETIIIPVAVHFYGNIDDSNMTCLQDVVDAQLAVLNEDFSATNADISNYDDFSTNCPSDFPADVLGTGTCLEFCLAKYDHPSCSGLVDGDPAITVGAESWPSAPCWSGYMNIFVTDELGFLGQAPVAGGADPDGNGVVIVASSFGGPGVSCSSGASLNNDGTYNLGRTGTHEVGHYFGLEHVFFGTCNNGDGIADTPKQNTENYGCPSLSENDCTTDAENSCSELDFFFNFMDYVNDACMWMFTEDQSTVMESTANHDMWADHAVVCETPDPPVADFSPVEDQQLCAGSTVLFTDLSSNNPTSWSWTFSGAGVSPTSSTEENPIVTLNTSGNLSVSVTATNSAGSDTKSEVLFIDILDSSDPSCFVCDYELVLWDTKEDGWNADQEISVDINGIVNTYSGPVSGTTSETIVLSVSDIDVLNLTCSPGSGSEANEIAWRLFDEEGRVATGDGNMFGIGPVGNQGANGVPIEAPGSSTITANGDCDAIADCFPFELSITLDDYPEETAWWITGATGEYQYQSLGYANQDNQTVSIDLCLQEGCYDFTIIDYYGDGICCGFGTGSYTLTELNTGEIKASGGDFNGEEITNFCVTVEDECPEELIVTGNINSETYSAISKIESDGNMADGINATFIAGDTISLQAGFELIAGAEFLAEIGDCIPSSKPIQNSETEWYDINGTLKYIGDKPSKEKIPSGVYIKKHRTNTGKDIIQKIIINP